MRKAARHAGVLFGVAVVGIAVIGAAYALWFEDLKLTATVTTGVFDADGSVHDLSLNDDNEGLPVVAQLPPSVASSVYDLLVVQNGYDAFGPFPENKPPVGCDAALEDFGTVPENANDEVEDNSTVLTLTGLYPYAGCEYEIDITNDGTVPLHATLIDVMLQRCTGVALDVCTDETQAPWTIALDPDMESEASATCAAFLGAIVTFTGDPIAIEGLQLHADESLVCRFKLIFDQAESEEGVKWVFMATWRAHQWNEAIPSP